MKFTTIIVLLFATMEYSFAQDKNQGQEILMENWGVSPQDAQEIWGSLTDGRSPSLLSPPQYRLRKRGHPLLPRPPPPKHQLNKRAPPLIPGPGPRPPPRRQLGKRSIPDITIEYSNGGNGSVPFIISSSSPSNDSSKNTSIATTTAITPSPPSSPSSSSIRIKLESPDKSEICSKTKRFSCSLKFILNTSLCGSFYLSTSRDISLGLACFAAVTEFATDDECFVCIHDGVCRVTKSLSTKAKFMKKAACDAYENLGCSDTC